MKKLLQTEQLAQLALAIAAIINLHVHAPWWAWPLLFLSPDLSMLGYLVNTRVGAFTYNLAHHKMAAGIVLATGYLMHQPALMTAGLLLWAHSSFDRIMGYGLKYPDAFQHTHLGTIGNRQKALPKTLASLA